MKNTPALRRAAAGLAAAFFLFLSACETTKVTDSWVAPDVTKLHFKEVLVIAATSDMNTRRTFEDEVVRAAPNTHAVASYAYFGDKVDIIDAEKVTAAVKASPFDAVVVMRLVSDQTKTSVNTTTMPTGAYGGSIGVMTPGPGYGYGGYGYGYGGYPPVGYRSFGGYYGDYGMTSTTVTTDHILSIETNIYELAGQKLVWSGLTASTSPGNVRQLAADVVAAVRQEMLKQKLISATPAK